MDIICIYMVVYIHYICRLRTTTNLWQLGLWHCDISGAKASSDCAGQCVSPATFAQLTPLSPWFAGTDSGATRSRGPGSNLALIFVFQISGYEGRHLSCPMFPAVFRYPWCLKTRFSATWQLKSCLARIQDGLLFASVLFDSLVETCFPTSQVENWCWEFGNCIRESYTALWPTWLLELHSLVGCWVGWVGWLGFFEMA